MSSLLATIFVFGLVILAHELGHFGMAKLSGVAVERLSVGFGPPLWVFKPGETEYRISVLPFGGYVKLAGQTPGAPVSPEMAERSYLALPLNRRAAILAAGPAANFLAALSIFVIVFAGFGVARLLPVVGSVAEGSPASAAGLRAGDRIVSVDGRPVARWEDLAERFAGKAGARVSVVWLRDGERRERELTPELSSVQNAYGQQTERAIIGVTPAGDASIDEVSVGAALVLGAKETWQLTRATLAVLYRLVSGAVSFSSLVGPVGIAQMSSEAARAGMHALLILTGVLSVNIGVINLLPIPLFDGGGLLFVLIEAVRKRPVSREVQQKVQMWSLAFLVMLTLIVLSNDIARLVAP